MELIAGITRSDTKGKNTFLHYLITKINCYENQNQ